MALMVAVKSVDLKIIATSQISYTAAKATTKDDEVVVSRLGRGMA
jgi:hypothetical protein